THEGTLTRFLPDCECKACCTRPYHIDCAPANHKRHPERNSATVYTLPSSADLPDSVLRINICHTYIFRGIVGFTWPIFRPWLVPYNLPCELAMTVGRRR